MGLVKTCMVLLTLAAISGGCKGRVVTGHTVVAQVAVAKDATREELLEAYNLIARNRKVEAQKRAEKEEIGGWFRVWLETPDAFFDWLEVRKQSPDYLAKFPSSESDE